MNIIDSNNNIINKEYTTIRMHVCRNCDYSSIILDNLIAETKLNNNTKSLIATIKQSKNYTQELISRTQHLPKSADIIERLYNVYYNINEVQLCPFCNEKPLKWSGRFLDGYKETCCSKECTSKLLISQREGLTIISENRDKKFIEWQNSVTTIDLWAFHNNQLTNVTIPNSVTTIGPHAFGYNKLTSVTIPNSVTTIESTAFVNNPNLKTITIDNAKGAISGSPWGATNATINYLR